MSEATTATLWAPAGAASEPLPSPPMLDARELTAGAPCVQIRLDQQVYTLRITRQGKLILTK